jgi:hypothetical protein
MEAVPRDVLPTLPPLPSWKFRYLMWIGSEESTPAYPRLKRRSATTPAGQMMCLLLDAARSPVEAVALTTCPWADCGQGSEQWAGRLVTSSIEPPESHRCNSSALPLSAVARRAFWETAVSYPAETGWRPLDWPDPLALAAASASVRLFSGRMAGVTTS